MKIHSTAVQLFHAVRRTDITKLTAFSQFYERAQELPHKENVVANITPVIQGVSRLVDITAGGDFLGLCDKKKSYKSVSYFGRLRSYGHFLIPVHALV